MASRLDLHNEFIDILGTQNEVESRVYFQPPSNITMKYDAIRYGLSGKDLKYANNRVYQNTNCYEGVVITRKPNIEIIDKILNHFEMITFGRPYIADNLNHYPFTLYY